MSFYIAQNNKKRFATTGLMFRQANRTLFYYLFGRGQSRDDLLDKKIFWLFLV
jgi:hypothetical protein